MERCRDGGPHATMLAMTMLTRIDEKMKKLS